MTHIKSRIKLHRKIVCFFNNFFYGNCNGVGQNGDKIFLNFIPKIMIMNLIILNAPDT